MVSMRISDPLLPVISEEFQIPTGDASVIAGAFAISYGISQFLFGPLADRFGKLYILGWALLLSVIANCGVSFSQQFDAIVFWRAVSGATTAGIVPLSMAWIGETVAYQERQPTLAKFLYGVLGGVIGGQIIGGFYADFGQWRGSFLVVAALYLICLALLMASGTAQRIIHQPETGPATKAHRHFINVFSNRWALFILCITGIEGVFLYGAMVFIPAYLHLELDIPLSLAGLMMSGFGLGGLLYASTARMMLSRLKETGLVWAGGVLLGIASLLLLVPVHWLIPATGIFAMGLGLYMLHNTLQTHATQMAPASRGTAVSLFACSLFIGQSIGISAAGALVDFAGFTPLFWISAIALPLLSLWFAHFLRRHPLNQR